MFMLGWRLSIFITFRRMSSNILENSLKHSGRFSTSKLGRLSMGYSHIEPFSLRNTAFSKPISTNSLQNISRGAIELHLKDFLFQGILKDFSNFLLSAVYPSMVHYNKSWAPRLHYIWLSLLGKNQTVFNNYQN